MLNFLYEFLPVLLFFIAFKAYGIYVATVVGIVISAVQLAASTAWKKKVDKKQLITLIIFVIFGGLTLYFHDPIFVKWKPTIIFWIFGAILFISQFIGKKPLMQRMLETMLEDKIKLPSFVWTRINLAWTIFLSLLGALNIFIAYHFSTETWVNFKFYGILGLLFLFTLLQSYYLARHSSEVK